MVVPTGVVVISAGVMAVSGDVVVVGVVVVSAGVVFVSSGVVVVGVCCSCVR